MNENKQHPASLSARTLSDAVSQYSHLAWEKDSRGRQYHLTTFFCGTVSSLWLDTGQSVFPSAAMKHHHCDWARYRGWTFSSVSRSNACADKGLLKAHCFSQALLCCIFHIHCCSFHILLLLFPQTLAVFTFIVAVFIKTIAVSIEDLQVHHHYSHKSSSCHCLKKYVQRLLSSNTGLWSEVSSHGQGNQHAHTHSLTSCYNATFFSPGNKIIMRNITAGRTRFCQASVSSTFLPWFQCCSV